MAGNFFILPESFLVDSDSDFSIFTQVRLRVYEEPRLVLVPQTDPLMVMLTSNRTDNPSTRGP